MLALAPAPLWMIEVRIRHTDRNVGFEINETYAYTRGPFFCARSTYFRGSVCCCVEEISPSRGTSLCLVSGLAFGA